MSHNSKTSRTRRRISPRVHIVPGDAPGTLHPVEGSAPAAVSVMTITPTGVRVDALADDAPLPEAGGDGHTAYWVRVTGLGSVDALRRICTAYGIRKMAMEDILSPGWRSRVELYGEYLFFVLQTPYDFTVRDKGEHLCFFCRDNLVLSFEERPTRVVDELWQRIKEGGQPRPVERPGLFLAYLALDAIVDRFFPHLNTCDETLSFLEDSLTDKTPEKQELQQLHQVKRELLTLRRLAAPYREISQSLLHQCVTQNYKELYPYLNDLNDHVIQAEDLVGCYQDIAKSLDDIYQTELTNRMNDIIRTLTIISTTFMPLSFLAGVYGMNFDASHPWNMPELTQPYGYPILLGLMLCISLGMLIFFKRKKWL